MISPCARTRFRRVRVVFPTPTPHSTGRTQHTPPTTSAFRRRRTAVSYPIHHIPMPHTVVATSQPVAVARARFLPPSSTIYYTTPGAADPPPASSFCSISITSFSPSSCIFFLSFCLALSSCRRPSSVCSSTCSKKTAAAERRHHDGPPDTRGSAAIRSTL